LTSTTTEAPVSRIVTRTRLPSGRVGLAAVIASWLKTAPLLVLWPLRQPPYHVAMPTSSDAVAPATPVAAPAMAGLVVRSAEANSPGSSRLMDMN
jgi:hypothetical protein